MKILTWEAIGDRRTARTPGNAAPVLAISLKARAECPVCQHQFGIASEEFEHLNLDHFVDSGNKAYLLHRSLASHHQCPNCGVTSVVPVYQQAKLRAEVEGLITENWIKDQFAVHAVPVVEYTELGVQIKQSA